MMPLSRPGTPHGGDLSGHDEYTMWDAAYVLGSLSSAERREFEAHMTDCPLCGSAVGELSGMPALLSQLDRDEMAAIDCRRGVEPSLPDELLRKSLDRLSPEEIQFFYQHPLRAQMVLTPVAQLDHVAHMIRHQYERFNGRGTPDGLSGSDIPFGSRILAVARDFEGLRSGGIVKQAISLEQTIVMLKSQAGAKLLKQSTIKVEPWCASSGMSGAFRILRCSPAGVCQSRLPPSSPKARLSRRMTGYRKCRPRAH